MPKLRVDQLDRALSQTIAPIYLVTGDEALLVQESCDKIRRAAARAGYSERELHHTDGGFQWESLLYAANSMSLFAEKKIIEIRVHNGKPGDDGGKALAAYCANVSQDNLLLLVFPKIDKRAQNSKWFQTLEKIATIISVWPVDAQQLPAWIAGRLSAAGLHASSEAIDILCAKIEGNLLAAVQEIEKLKLIVEGGVIDPQTMTDAVTDSARYDLFKLVDKGLLGDARGAVVNLHGLRGEGSDPVLILWALAREIRTLCTIKESMHNGKSFDFSARQMGVWDNRSSMIKQAVNRLHLSQLHRLVKKSGEADRIIKGMQKGDAWNILLDMVLSLAGIQVLAE